MRSKFLLEHTGQVSIHSDTSVQDEFTEIEFAPKQVVIIFKTIFKVIFDADFTFLLQSNKTLSGSSKRISGQIPVTGVHKNWIHNF